MKIIPQDKMQRNLKYCQGRTATQLLHNKGCSNWQNSNSTRKIKVSISDIEWVKDEELTEGTTNLPQETVINLEVPINFTKEDIHDKAIDTLSETYGFLVRNAAVDIVNSRKTQLSILLNGRNDMPGFHCINKQTGSSHSLRSSLFDKIHKENPNGLDITCAGISVHLNEHKSKSGKTNQWLAEIQESDAIKILGFNPPHSYQIRFEMVIHQDLYVEVCWQTRKSESRQWKTSGCKYLNPINIKIL